MKIQPFGNNVIVAVNRNEEAKTSGGIIVTSVAETYFKAEVLAVGEGLVQLDGSTVKPQSKVGDIALLPKQAEMIRVTIENGKDIYVIDDRSLLGKLNE